MFSILHISDLHRSPDEPIDNDSLIAALVNDHDRYMGEISIIPPPEAVVVSGDIIQGAKLGESHWQEKVRAQYDVAASFLDQIAQRFLSGDRSRLILVPGNHDVCWNTSFSAMERIAEADYPDNIPYALAEAESPYRWNWKERALYRVADATGYGARLDAYWSFVERFYDGVPLIVDIDRSRGFQLYELDQGRVIVAAFESVYGNDCFSYSGALPIGAIGRCYLALRDLPRAPKLRMAVWHHSIQGPPRQTDYMDVAHVQEMAGHGFQLGLHGHQHVAAAATQYVHLTESQAIAVVSAGSLCAGSRDLPRGVDRQYNLVVVDEDYRHARVHVREMTDGGHFTRKTDRGFGQGYVEIAWQPPLDVAGREIDADIENERRAAFDAEKALHADNPSEVLTLLGAGPFPPGTYVRRLALEAARRTEDWNRIKAIVGDERSPEEAVLLVGALERLSQFDEAMTVLSECADLDPNTRRELEQRISIRKTMSSQ